MTGFYLILRMDTMWIVDFAKAFDKVDHGILSHKMRKLGIKGRLGKWLHDFLTDRTQVVLANGAKSTESKVKSGVPQGTVLGPILFLIMINDIDEEVHGSSVSLFCDDTRIMKAIDDEHDVELLQEDLDTLYYWQKSNNMLFNCKKFEILRYGPKEDLKNNTQYFTPEYEDIIEAKESLRDLGIILSSDGKFKQHINNVCSKVRRKCGWVLRTFSCRSVPFMKFIWKSLIQPHIDYCSQLYLPTSQGEMESIENLQKVFTKKIPALDKLNYWERLKKLKMYSQQRRLERYRILYAWKILSNLAPNCGLVEVTSERRGRQLRIPLHKGRPGVKSLRDQSFQVHGPQLFNFPPLETRNDTSISLWMNSNLSWTNFLKQFLKNPTLGT